MESLTCDREHVNAYDDLTCRSKFRTREQVRRILQLVDLMARYRHHQSALEVSRAFNDSYGTTWTYRTIHRDLVLLADMGLVDSQRGDYHGFKPERFKLNLKKTELLQTVAIVAG